MLIRRLSAYLKDHELTQVEFAKLCRVTQPTVSGWVSGEVQPNIKSLLTISKVTGLSLDELTRMPRDIPAQH